MILWKHQRGGVTRRDLEQNCFCIDLILIDKDMLVCDADWHCYTGHSAVIIIWSFVKHFIWETKIKLRYQEECINYPLSLQHDLASLSSGYKPHCKTYLQRNTMLLKQSIKSHALISIFIIIPTKLVSNRASQIYLYCYCWLTRRSLTLSKQQSWFIAVPMFKLAVHIRGRRI